MWTIDAISTRFRHGGHATTLINYVPLANERGRRKGNTFVRSKRFEIFIRRFDGTRLSKFIDVAGSMVSWMEGSSFSSCDLTQFELRRGRKVSRFIFLAGLFIYFINEFYYFQHSYVRKFVHSACNKKLFSL